MSEKLDFIDINKSKANYKNVKFLNADIFDDVLTDEYFDFIHHDGTIHKPQLAPQRKVGLSKIIGEKYVFTNARKDWAMSGLESMGILESFERLFDIEYFDWSCNLCDSR